MIADWQHHPWTSCQIRKLAGAHAPGMLRTFSPPPRVSNPDMHQGTCVTHVPWCMPGSLTHGFLWISAAGENVPGIPGACVTLNFTYLVRGPWYWLCRIGACLSYTRKNFNYLCGVWVEELYKVEVHFCLCYETFRTKRINSLRPGEAYMRQCTNHYWFRWCLVAWSAPSHYVNQCWNIVNWTLGNKLQCNLNKNLYIFIHENAFENVICKMVSILSRPQCVK